MGVLSYLGDGDGASHPISWNDVGHIWSLPRRNGGGERHCSGTPIPRSRRSFAAITIYPHPPAAAQPTSARHSPRRRCVAAPSALAGDELKHLVKAHVSLAFATAPARWQRRVAEPDRHPGSLALLAANDAQDLGAVVVSGRRVVALDELTDMLVGEFVSPDGVRSPADDPPASAPSGASSLITRLCHPGLRSYG